MAGQTPSISKQARNIAAGMTQATVRLSATRRSTVGSAAGGPPHG